MKYLKLIIGLIRKKHINNSSDAYLYATEVIKGRFPQGEPAIAQSPATSYYYAAEVIKGRWSEGEEAIAKDAYFAYQYALWVIKDRFPEGEKIISQDSIHAYYYAKNVIKGSWLEGEASISESPEFSYYYAELTGNRFLPGEEGISQNIRLRDNYADKFFPNKDYIMKNEVDEFEWNRLDLPGYFAVAESFEQRMSLLDMMIEQ
jgi:hypothetical protein